MEKYLIDMPAPGAGQHTEPELTSVRKFRSDLGIVASTFWRWEQRGWIDHPLNIGGRLYLTADMIRKFRHRAAAGEFSSPVRPPKKGAKQL